MLLPERIRKKIYRWQPGATATAVVWNATLETGVPLGSFKKVIEIYRV